MNNQHFFSYRTIRYQYRNSLFQSECTSVFGFVYATPCAQVSTQMQNTIIFTYTLGCVSQQGCNCDDE